MDNALYIWTLLATAGLLHVRVHGHCFFHSDEPHLFVHVALDHSPTYYILTLQM